ncbi:unnamed protein product [Mytilus coruscus]|uniref:Reverse transcriptase domain-containing protein n=1 Tax=Mytilus coruscus TaxID=42192 RepID=A0A6J8A413_MYTCO|nr:unnamed protein product [Mytilus coruscus]
MRIPQQLPPQFDFNRPNSTVHPTSTPLNHPNIMNSYKDNRRNVTNDGGINITFTGQTIYYSPPSHMTQVKYHANISPGTRAAPTTNKTALTHPRYNGTSPSSLHTNMYSEPRSMKDHDCNFIRDMKQKIDVFLIQEHWLFHCELNMLSEIHTEIAGSGKSVDSDDPISASYVPRGYGGVAILWNKSIDKYIKPISDGSNRIHCVIN